jgi:hypothetical protein
LLEQLLRSLVLELINLKVVAEHAADAELRA